MAKSKHWHIDYLRRFCSVSWAGYSIGSEDLEHEWSHLLLKMAEIEIPLKGFGSSDCGCSAHLFYHEEDLPVEMIKRFSFGGTFVDS